MPAAGLSTRKLPVKHFPYRTNAAYLATFTIGPEGTKVDGTAGTNVIAVRVQLRDENNRIIAQRVGLRLYFSDDAAGDTIAATAITTVAVGVSGVYLSTTTGKAGYVITESDGTFDLDLTLATGTRYLILVMPDGSLFPCPTALVWV